MQFFAPTHVYLEKNCVDNHKQELLSYGKRAFIITGNIPLQSTVLWRMSLLFLTRRLFRISSIMTLKKILPRRP